MCGIAGFVDLDTPDRQAVLRAMTASLHHRGPDDTGFYLDDRCGLGMTRLSILDIEHGQQPKTAADGAIQVVFNGEIYNFAEVRRELETRGHRFETRSDTEVVARAFAEWGEAAFPRLHGMFAVAAWDRRAARLVLARDRIGKKPLYVWTRGRACVFASEPKALRAVGPLPEIDDGALATYLHLGYVPSPASIWQGIAKLAPGHVAVFEEGMLSSSPYWIPPEPAAQVDAGVASPPGAAAAELDELLTRAVRARLVADVEVGVLLSGGVDSTLVAAAAADARPIRTFTVAFDDPRFDESAAAASAAHAVGSDHHVLPATATEALGMVDHMVDVFDEPLADASAIPTMLVARLAREHVKVVLGGDGGDELFGGYERYRSFERMWSIGRRLPPRARAAGPWLLRAPIRTVRRAGLLLERLDPHPAVMYRNAAAVVTPAVVNRLLGRPVRFPVSARFEAAFAGGIAAGPRRADLVSYLPDDVLVKVDRATMAYGLEARSPFLDTALVEWALRLPADAIGPPGAKALPRALLRRRVPSVADRPKQGFSVPLASWLRGPLAPLVAETLSPAELRRHGRISMDGVDLVRRRLAAGAPGGAAPVWALVAFQRWYDRWGR